MLLRNEGDEIRTLEELKGIKIAGIHKDYAMEVLKEKVPELDIQEYNSIDECAKVLIFWAIAYGGLLEGSAK